MRDESVSPKHWPGGQRVSQHPQRRLEASPYNQLNSLRSPIPLSGEYFIVRQLILHKIMMVYLIPGTQSRGSSEQGGSAGASEQQEIVWAKRWKVHARRKHQWCIFWEVLQVKWRLKTKPQLDKSEHILCCDSIETTYCDYLLVYLFMQSDPSVFKLNNSLKYKFCHKLELK